MSVYFSVIFDSDSASSGSRFVVAGSTSLGHMLVDIAEQIPHPTDSERTLWDARFDTGPFNNSINEGVKRPPAKGLDHADGFSAAKLMDTLRVGDLGSGSDYTVFFHHLGVSFCLLDPTSPNIISSGFEHPWSFPRHNFRCCKTVSFRL